MIKKLFLYIATLLFILSFDIVAVLIFTAYYNNVETANDTVKQKAQSYADLYNREGLSALMQTEPDMRVTIIASDGTVMSDSYPVDMKILKNYLQCPEIQAALNNSPSPCLYNSNTAKGDFVYYALKVETESGDYMFVRVVVPVAKIDIKQLTEMVASI